MLTCGGELVAPSSGPEQAIALQLIESVVNRLLRAPGDANEIARSCASTAGDLFIDGDQQLLATVLEVMAISHPQLASFEHIAEASVVGAAKLQAMLDPHAFPSSVVFDFDQVNNAGYRLKCRVAADALH